MNPIFIMGNPRSGSSALTSCLKNVLNIQGYNEGHFLKYINNYKETTDKIFNNLSIHEKNPNVTMGNINRDKFFKNILQSFKQTYESLFDNSKLYWLDKTPGCLRQIEYLLFLWPNSKFIMLKRRSLENIKSRTLKFLHRSFEEHCREWNSNMISWYNFDKTIILNKNYIEIEHYDMLFNLNKISNDLIKLLPEYSDKKQGIIDFFSSKYPESTTGKKPEILDIDTIDWTDDQKNIHYKICSKTLELYNYSLNKSYFNENKAK
jgi:hypothetical protein